jgi:AbrB family looped-hinge helix DNA binding protein
MPDILAHEHAQSQIKGQVTLRKDVLEHLGIHPGDQICVEKLPDGRIEVRAVPAGCISSVFGLLKQEARRVLCTEEMNEITRKGWSGAGGQP